MTISPLYRQGPGGFYDVRDGSGPYALNSAGQPYLLAPGVLERFDTKSGEINGRMRVDVGQTGFFDRRQFRISLEMTIGATPLWLRFTSPVNFILQRQDIDVDQGGIRMRAYRSTQGAPGGSFATPVPIWSNNGMDEAPEYIPQVTIFSGGTFTPSGGQSPTETIRVMSNPGGGGPTAGSRNTASGDAFGERGLAAGSYYLNFERLSAEADGVGVFGLLWEERP